MSLKQDIKKGQLSCSHRLLLSLSLRHSHCPTFSSPYLSLLLSLHISLVLPLPFSPPPSVAPTTSPHSRPPNQTAEPGHSVRRLPSRSREAGATEPYVADICCQRRPFACLPPDKGCGAEPEHVHSLGGPLEVEDSGVRRELETSGW